MFLDWYFINIDKFLTTFYPTPPYFHIGINDTKSWEWA